MKRLQRVEIMLTSIYHAWKVTSDKWYAWEEQVGAEHTGFFALIHEQVNPINFIDKPINKLWT